MYKTSITTLLFSIILLLECTGNKEPVIKIGKNFDKTKLEVSLETDVFTRYDNFAFSLSYEKPFNVKIINRRLYKGKVYIDLLLKESVDIKIQPGAKIIGGSFPVRDIVNKYGSGDYMLMFVFHESVIAKKVFSIKGYEQKGNDSAGTKVYNEIMPERPNRDMPVQPDAMTRDQKPDDSIMQGRTDRDTVQPKTVARDQKLPEVTIPKKPARNMVSPSEMMGND